MKAIKGNRVYTITEADKKAFVNEGFDILDDEGKVVAYGKGKTVPYETYAKVKEQVKALQDAVDALEDEVKALKKKSTKKTAKKADEVEVEV